VTTASAARFASAAMAERYAHARPAVHPHVLADALAGRTGGRALDVGCGAGLSTGPLVGRAAAVLGIDPFPAMVTAARALVPGAAFAVGRAEGLPVADGSVDLITAAGALDFADLEAFSAEAVRVLAPGGAVLAYDFSAGRSLADRPGLERWYAAFRDRWDSPRPVFDLRPALAAGSLLRLDRTTPFTVDLAMSRDAYLAAVLSDAPDPDDAALVSWCRDTLPAAFGPEEQVRYQGWTAWLHPA